MSSAPLQLVTTDGYTLAADRIRAPEPTVAVVVASATGVPRQLYRRFAEYLAARGASVLTFDYRGIGGSRPSGSLRGFAASAQQWATHDLEAALRAQRSTHPNLPLVVVGHSIGGQLLPLASSSSEVSAALLIAAQSGYWKLWDGVPRLKVWLYWHVVFPPLLAAFGYLPMRMLTGGEDLPKGMAREWMEWGRHPEYILTNRIAREEKAFERFRAPMLFYGFSDDVDYAPPRAVDKLAAMYANAPREVRHISPRDIGSPTIGHFAAFKPAYQETLWREWRDWILEKAER